MKLSRTICASYNKAIEDGFNAYLEKNATSEKCDLRIDEGKLINEIEGKWLDKTIEGMGTTARQYIESIDGFEDVIDFFIEFAELSDVGVPDIVLDKLKKYPKEASDKLFSFVLDIFDQQKPENNIAASQAVYAIGSLGTPEYSKLLPQLLNKTYDNEMLSESVCAAISEYGADALDDIIEAYGNSTNNEVKQYLLTCVVEATREQKSDKAFYFLKEAFRQSGNIQVELEVLGDYGDSRAIPMLRGYVQKNREQLSKQILNNFLAVIKKLGGDIDDLL